MVADSIQNLTPYANMQFTNLDAQGREFGVFMVKTAWDIGAGGVLSLSDEQEPFIFTDEHHGELNKSAVRYPSDLVPYKPATDLILNATAFAGEDALPAWEASVTARVAGTETELVHRRLEVRGPAQWTEGLTGWRLSAPEPITQLDLRYDYAFGGSQPVGEDAEGNPVVEAYEYNPIGRGFAKKPHEGPIPAAQIVAPGHTFKDPWETPAPVGVGPIPPAWLPRRPLGGTYDAHWEDNVWPGWPADYKFAFHNSASEGMTFALPLGQGMDIELRAMHPDHPVWRVHVPDPGHVVHLVTRDGKHQPHAMRLDTVMLDIAADRLDDPRVFLVSRLAFDPTNVDTIVLDRRRDITPELLAPPRPDQVARAPAQEDV